MKFQGPHADTLAAIQGKKILVVGDLIVDQEWLVSRKEGADGDARLNVDIAKATPGGAGLVAEQLAKMGADPLLLTYSGPASNCLLMHHAAKWKLLNGVGNNKSVLRTAYEDRMPLSRYDTEGDVVLTGGDWPESFDEFDAIAFVDYGRGVVSDKLVSWVIDHTPENKPMVAMSQIGECEKFENRALLVINRKTGLKSGSAGAVVTHDGPQRVCLLLCGNVVADWTPARYSGTLPTWGCGDQLMAAIAAVIPMASMEGAGTKRPLVDLLPFAVECARGWIEHKWMTPYTVEMLSAGRRVMLTSGCFDPPHPGHVNFLRAAVDHALARRARLIVCVNDNESLEKLRNRKPHLDYEQRSDFVRSVLDPYQHQETWLDYRVLPLRESDPCGMADMQDAVWIIKGADWKDKAVPEAEGRELIFVDRSDGWASSKMAEACQIP